MLRFSLYNLATYGELSTLFYSLGKFRKFLSVVGFFSASERITAPPRPYNLVCGRAYVANC